MKIKKTSKILWRNRTEPICFSVGEEKISWKLREHHQNMKNSVKTAWCFLKELENEANFSVKTRSDEIWVFDGTQTPIFSWKQRATNIKGRIAVSKAESSWRTAPNRFPAAELKRKTRILKQSSVGNLGILRWHIFPGRLQKFYVQPADSFPRKHLAERRRFVANHWPNLLNVKNSLWKYHVTTSVLLIWTKCRLKERKNPGKIL